MCRGSSIRYQNINPQASYANDTHLGRSESSHYSMRVSDIKILDNMIAISIMPLINQTKPRKHMSPLCF